MTDTMTWSQFSIKIAELHFGNSVHANNNWGNIFDNSTKKIDIWKRVRLSFRGKK